MASSILKRNELDSLLSSKHSQPGDVYVSNPSLNDAIKAAFLLRQPLLLTGDPGTGKTTLGNKLARELNRISNGSFFEKPLFFSTKSISIANDLFYVYDAISHFQSVNIKPNFDNQNPTFVNDQKTVSDFIKLQALGIAILAGNRDILGNDSALLNQLPSIDDSGNPKNFVIIIDEIDKAPRDFPNDILYEIESLSFKIKEKGNIEFVKNGTATIFVIMTSNSEKSLPEAFLRRCVFHHIDYPSKKILKEILLAHNILNSVNLPINEKFIFNCLDLFNAIREKCNDKKPSTAELINWVRYLAYNNFEFTQVNSDILKTSLPIIIKSKQDLKLISEAGIIS